MSPLGSRRVAASTTSVTLMASGRHPEGESWNARRQLVLLCHVMRRTDVFQIRINPNSATASRDFAMNGTSTSAPGLATSSRRHPTANSRLTSRRRRDNPSPAGDPASSTTAGAPCSTDPMPPPSRRTRVEPRSASPTAGAAPGRPRSPRSSPATSSASSSATPAAHAEQAASAWMTSRRRMTALRGQGWSVSGALRCLDALARRPGSLEDGTLAAYFAELHDRARRRRAPPGCTSNGHDGAARLHR